MRTTLASSIDDEAAAAAEPGAPATLRAGYRPHLDGMRAIAVYLVVLFHAGAERFAGGFVGVDVFFILSGYLVTQVLLRDVAERGSIRFGRFYARRFRRLLPAAFVALIGTATVFAAVASPVETLDAITAFKASFLYSANWYFVHEGANYFGADVANNPVLHFWSLAVEEQFYLLWPLALAAVFALTSRFAPRRPMAVRVVVAVAGLASLAWAVWLRSADPGRAYYGTDARAYQLLAGATIALVPAFVSSPGRQQRSMRVAAAVSLIVLLLVASDLTDVDAIVRGIAATIATCVLIVAVESAQGGAVNRVLSSRPMVYLGKISYGTYLWHWPVLLVAARVFHPSPLSAVAIALVFATALAALSAALLEQPVRESALLDRHGRLVIVSGLAISVVAALVLIPAVMVPADSAPPVVETATTRRAAPVSRTLDWQHAKWDLKDFPDCTGQPAERCTVVKGTGRHVLLMGDSHAWMWLPAFTEIARRENLTLSVTVHTACPWQRDLFVHFGVSSGHAARPEDCKKYKDDVYDRVIPELEPDVVVLAQVNYEELFAGRPFLGPDLVPMKNDKEQAYSSGLEKATESSVAALQSGGRDVLIIEPIPMAPESGLDPLVCLSVASVLDQCRYVASATPSLLETVYRDLVKRDSKVRTADLDRMVCPYFPICDPVVNGLIVKWDRTHLTVKFAESLADRLDVYLKMLGLIPLHAKVAATATSPGASAGVLPSAGEEAGRHRELKEIQKALR